MTKKEARKICREKAIESKYGMWPLCWTKQNGFYPASSYTGYDINFVCYVKSNGTFCGYDKQSQVKFNLK